MFILIEIIGGLPPDISTIIVIGIFNDKTRTIFEHFNILDKKQSTLDFAKDLEISYKAASRMVKLINGSIYTNCISNKL